MGLVALPGQGPYAASKFAVRAIGLTLAQELHGSGVGDDDLPGFVESDIARTDNRGKVDASRKDRARQRSCGPPSVRRASCCARGPAPREMVFTRPRQGGRVPGQALPRVWFTSSSTRSGIGKKGAGVEQAGSPRGKMRSLAGVLLVACRHGAPPPDPASGCIAGKAPPGLQVEVRPHRRRAAAHRRQDRQLRDLRAALGLYRVAFARELSEMVVDVPLGPGQR
jgi:hypothetical protein